MIKKYFIVFFIFVFTQAYAQDPIHTQFFMIPETLSSSFTGAKKSTRAGIIHRTQWPGLNFSLNTQFAFVDNWFDKFNSGIGISVLNHQETTTRYSFTQVNLNYAYHFPISSEWNARPSISFGYGAKDFGFQNLLLEDQINIFSGIINNTSIDLINLNDSVRFVDFSASVLFNSENSSKSPVCLTPPGREKPCVTNGFTLLIASSSLSIWELIINISSDYIFYSSF